MRVSMIKIHCMYSEILKELIKYLFLKAGHFVGNKNVLKLDDNHGFTAL